MSNLICHINLDYDPENEELAVILNNADNFCNALELADIDFDSIKICIDSPKHYQICEREAPIKITVPIQEEEWDEDEEEEFFAADTCWEEEDDDEFDIDSECQYLDDTDEHYFYTKSTRKQ